jgi:hypothetical protein
MRQIIRAEIEKQQQRPPKPTSPERARMLGAFLQACLTNQGRSSADFARALDADQELADAILEGLLPASQMDDELLVEIARAVEYEPNVLRAMLGRAVTPAESDNPAFRSANHRQEKKQP